MTLPEIKQIYHPCGELSTLTKGHSPANNNLPSELTPDVFNAHFVSVVSKFLPDDQTDGYNCSDRLLNFCSDRISQNTAFSIPPITVFEVGISISKMDNKKSTGCDGISVKLLKIALLYIAETLTYIYNLCIQKNVFPTAFKTAKVIPLPKTKAISTDLNDYRHISILSVLTKPLERHIHKHLTVFLFCFVFRNTPAFPFLSVWLPMWAFLSNYGYSFN